MRGFAPEFDGVAVRPSVRLVIRVAVDFLLGAAAVFLLKFGKALANKTPFNAPLNFIARGARDFKLKARQSFLQTASLIPVK